MRQGNAKRIQDFEYALKHTDEMEIRINKFWEMVNHYVQTPYWQRDPAQFERDFASLTQNPWGMLKDSPIKNLDIDIRCLIARSKMLQTELAAALEIYRLAKGRYPEESDGS